MRKILFTFVAALFGAGAVLAQEGTFTRLSGPMSRAEYPLPLGDRPLVLPSMMAEGTTGFEFDKISPDVNASQIGLRLGFGVGDLAQIDAISGILVDPDQEWSKIVAGRLAFLAYDSRELDVAPSVLVPFDFHDNADLVSQVGVGAETRYRFNHMVYAFGMRDLLYFENMRTSPTDKQWQVGLNGTFGAGVSPIPNLSLELQATLFHLKLAGDLIENQSIGDVIPVGAKALIAVSRQFDVYGTLVMNDLRNGADSMTFFGGLNARL